MRFSPLFKAGYPLKLALLLLVLLQFVFGISGGILAAGLYYARSDRIVPGVEVSGVSLHGLTRIQALELLESSLELPPEISLVWEGKRFVIPLEPSTGRYLFEELIDRVEDDFTLFNIIRWFPHAYRLTPAVEVSPLLITEELTKIKEIIDQEAEDARIIVEEGVPRVVAERWGISLDLEGSQETILKYLAMGMTEDIPLQVTRIPPQISGDQLPDFSNLLGSSSTPLGESEPDRRHNIALATETFNLLQIEPGKIFSFNETLGPATLEKGFLQVLMIQNGQFVPGVGGGICQVATTIYQAALKAELEIVQRSAHSRPVFYVPLGQDATVSYNLLDLKIRNNLKSPVMLVGEMDDLNLHFKIFGAAKDGNRRVELSSEEVEVLSPKLLEQPDPNLPLGVRQLVREGEEGYKVNVYRIVYENEMKVARELISTDYYMPVHAIVRVGTKQVSPRLK